MSSKRDEHGALLPGEFRSSRGSAVRWKPGPAEERNSPRNRREVSLCEFEVWVAIELNELMTEMVTAPPIGVPSGDTT